MFNFPKEKLKKSGENFENNELSRAKLLLGELHGSALILIDFTLSKKPKARQTPTRAARQAITSSSSLGCY